MDRREREVQVGQLHLALIFGEDVVQYGLNTATEWALKIREFHDGDRGIGISLNSSRVIVHVDDRGLKENGNFGLVTQGARILFAGLLDLGIFQELLHLRLDLVEGQSSLALNGKIIAL